jgi:integrase
MEANTVDCPECGRRQKIVLTDKFLRAYRPEKNTEIFDAHTSAPGGFGVRCGRETVSYFLVYRRKNKGKFRHRIGTYGAETNPQTGIFTLADARAEAERIRGTKAHPVGEARRIRESGTFADIAERYLQAGCPRAKKLAKEPLRPDTVESYKNHLRNVLIPQFGAYAIDQISREDVKNFFEGKIATAFDKNRARPVHANRCLATMRRVISWAVSNGWAVSNPCAGQDKPGGKEEPTPREWTDDELRAVLVAVERESLVWRALVKFAFLTGCRSGELRQARWTWVDMSEDGKERLNLPKTATKGRRPRTVPLSRQACEVLAALREKTGSGELLFPGRRKGAVLTRVDSIIERICTTSGVTFTIHNVRDALAEFAADEERGGSLDLAGRLLGHKVAKGALAHYAKSENIPAQRRMLQAWADHLTRLTTKEEAESAKILEFSR